ncbi:MAG: PAS domain-containing sensor histidine kinase [Cyanobacteria bacterium P01_D01_bin.56]
MNKQPSEAAIRMNAIIQTATDGIITIDRKGIIEIANPAAAQLFGYQPEEMIGNNINMLMPEPYHSAHDGYMDNYHRTGKAKIIGIGREVTGQRKNGDTFPCRLSISKVELSDRILYTGIIHDLSEQKTAEEALRQEKELTQQLNLRLEERVEERTEELADAVNQLLGINRQLELEINTRKTVEVALRKSEEETRSALEKEKELNQLKSRFVSMASHEFRTPLSTILSSADLIELYEKAEQQAKRLRHTARIKSSVSTLTGILNDFLSLSKFEEGKIKAHPIEFDLHKFCKDSMEAFQQLLRPNQQLLHEGAKEQTWIVLDKKILQNVINNLMSNAIKYSPKGGTIYCSVVVTNDQLYLQVKDEGIGIPEEEQQHLFSRFFRAHNVENIQGTGLGLNIVKRYIDLMEGTITFESKAGVGTTFYITIPLQQTKNS